MPGQGATFDPMVKTPDNVHVIVLAGGPGTRLWPISSDKLPKPYLAIPGPRTLIEETVARARKLAPPNRVWVVALKEQLPLLRKYLPKMDEGQWLLEPEARNTAAAIAFGTAAILKRDPEAIIAVTPADHVVSEPDALVGALAKAARFCEDEYGIVCVGIKPTEPATGYGYLAMGKKKNHGVHQLKRFIEKPKHAKAKDLVKKGALWNAGMFVFKGEVLINELEQHLPELHAPLAAALSAKTEAATRKQLLSNYEKLPKISIDYAVMEKTKHACAIKCACGWSDVGTWTEALRVSGGKIESENGTARWIRDGEVVCGETGKLTAALGFGKAILVEGPGGRLILHPDSASSVGDVAKEAAKIQSLAKKPAKKSKKKKA